MISYLLYCNILYFISSRHIRHSDKNLKIKFFERQLHKESPCAWIPLRPSFWSRMVLEILSFSAGEFITEFGVLVISASKIRCQRSADCGSERNGTRCERERQIAGCVRRNSPQTQRAEQNESGSKRGRRNERSVGWKRRRAPVGRWLLERIQKPSVN